MGSTMLGMTELPLEQLVVASLIGSLSFVVHIIQTKIPLSSFDKMDQKANIDQPGGGGSESIEGGFNKVKGFFNKQEGGDDDDQDDGYHRMPEIQEPIGMGGTRASSGKSGKSRG